MLLGNLLHVCFSAYGYSRSEDCSSCFYTIILAKSLRQFIRKLFSSNGLQKSYLLYFVNAFGWWVWRFGVWGWMAGWWETSKDLASYWNIELGEVANLFTTWNVRQSEWSSCPNINLFIGRRKRQWPTTRKASVFGQDSLKSVQGWMNQIVASCRSIFPCT